MSPDARPLPPGTQRGSAIMIALFVIVIMALLAAAMGRFLVDSGEKNTVEVRGVRALMAALTLARDLGARSLTVRTDSLVLLEQLGPPMAKPARPIVRLSQLFEAARAQMLGFDELVLQWVPRHRNTEADALARMAHSAAALHP